MANDYPIFMRKTSVLIDPFRRWQGAYLAMFACALLAGCSRQDVDKVGAMGKVVGEKVRSAAPQNLPVDELKPDASPAQRVRQRISSDVFLSNLSIDVASEGDGLHLRGTVPSREHADRAVQLARDTVGVKNVVDELIVKE